MFDLDCDAWAHSSKMCFPPAAFLRKKKSPFTTYRCQTATLTVPTGSAASISPCKGFGCLCPRTDLTWFSYSMDEWCRHEMPFRGLPSLPTYLHLNSDLFSLVFSWAIPQGWPCQEMSLTGPDPYSVWIWDLPDSYGCVSDMVCGCPWCHSLQERPLPGKPYYLLWVQAPSSSALAPSSRSFSLCYLGTHMLPGFHQFLFIKSGLMSLFLVVCGTMLMTPDNLFVGFF